MTTNKAQTKSKAGETAPLPAADELPGHKVALGIDAPLRLDCGIELGPFTVAYQT